ncbi:MAG TPA: DUF3800 domain-containing protein [Thermoplasmatales archaeon]|nr:DUF3800 domain-containing protein [Thermoplasmatales archaeon]
MIFCFIDESENRISDSEYYLILLGVFVSSDSLFEASFGIEHLKEEFGLKNLKELRDTNRFKQEEKLNVTKCLVDILKKYDIRFIGVIEFPTRLKNDSYDYKRKSLYYHAVWLLSERATLYAKKNNKKWLLIADNLRYKEGIVRKIKENIRNEMRIEGEAFNLKIKDYLFETPFFVEDESSNFIQVADLVALSLNHALRNYIRRYEHGYSIKTESLNEFSPYLSHYWPLFNRSPEGKNRGMGYKSMGLL